MSRVFGIDVGGTSVKFGLMDQNGEVLKKWSIPTRTEEGGRHILPDIAESVKEVILELSMDPNEIVGVGIGLPGPVDENGVVYGAVNLGWEKTFDIETELSGLLGGISVKAANDANIAALGELWQGAGKGYKEMLMVTLGTGIGGGVIHDGKIVAGVHGAGGEIGHICVNHEETIACNCGKCGCLEQYASATGLVRLAREELSRTTDESILRGAEPSAKLIWDAVKDGDEVAKRIAERFGFYLGFALSGVASVLDPEVIVIGGGVSMAGEVVLPYISKNIQKYAFRSCRDVKVVLATLANDAGIIGAGKLVLG